MHTITITLEPDVLCFYERIADAMHLSVEQILSDSLFKLAGELSLNAINTSVTSSASEYFS